MKNITISITISPEAKAMLKTQSSVFGGNQSAYITHLILKEGWNLQNENKLDLDGMDAATYMINYGLNKLQNSDSSAIVTGSNKKTKASVKTKK